MFEIRSLLALPSLLKSSPTVKISILKHNATCYGVCLYKLLSLGENMIKLGI